MPEKWFELRLYCWGDGTLKTAKKLLEIVWWSQSVSKCGKWGENGSKTGIKGLGGGRICGLGIVLWYYVVDFGIRLMYNPAAPR